MLKSLQRYGRVTGLIALLCALALTMLGFGGSAQAPLPPASPVSVGQVTNLRASATGQVPGTVKLTWNAAANAQVYFVVFLRSSDAMAGNYDSVRMKAFTGTEGVISGLPVGAPYHFIATGMRWNWPAYGATWGAWSAWSSARVSAGSVATDRAALIAFYHATNGPNWTNNSNWLSAMPLNQWHGVTTDHSGRVTSLDLHSNKLTGPIPPALGYLIHLRVLKIGNNQLTGEIPSELGNLSNLRELLLWKTQVTGAIPWELGNLSNLSSLMIDGNRLTGEIPAELGNLANLRFMRLSSNQLTGEIPAELGSLSKLESLEINTNKFTGAIPPALGNLTNLDNLRLYDNRLTGQIPPDLGNLVKLKWLHLHNNQLAGEIPAKLGNLVNLEAISLYGNQLTGCVPSALRNVPYNDYTRLGLPFCT